MRLCVIVRILLCHNRLNITLIFNCQSPMKILIFFFPLSWPLVIPHQKNFCIPEWQHTVLKWIVTQELRDMEFVEPVIKLMNRSILLCKMFVVLIHCHFPFSLGDGFMKNRQGCRESLTYLIALSANIPYCFCGCYELPNRFDKFINFSNEYSVIYSNPLLSVPAVRFRKCCG